MNSLIKRANSLIAEYQHLGNGWNFHSFLSLRERRQSLVGNKPHTELLWVVNNVLLMFPNNFFLN